MKEIQDKLDIAKKNALKNAKLEADSDLESDE